MSTSPAKRQAVKRLASSALAADDGEQLQQDEQYNNQQHMASEGLGAGRMCGSNLDQKAGIKRGRGSSAVADALAADQHELKVENEEELTYTVIEVLDVPQGITPEQISVYIDEDDELVVQAEYPGVVELTPSDDVYGDFEVSEDIKAAIDRSMSFAKLSTDKDPIFRRAIAELLTTNTSVSHTWRKYKINHITLTKYYRMANEFLKGEAPSLKKGKRQKSDVGGSVFRRVLQIPQGVLKETVKCYFEPWDGRLTITAALAPDAAILQQHEGDGAEGQEEVGGADDEEQHQVQLGKIEAVERN